MRQTGVMGQARTALFAGLVCFLAGCGGEPGNEQDPRTRMLEDLASTVPETRISAATQLGLLRDKTAVVALTGRLGDIRLDVRKAAVEALGRIGDPRAVGPLCDMVSDESADRELRKLAADALGSIGDAGAVPALAAVLRLEDEAIAFAAAYALGSIGEPSLDALSEALERGESHTRRAAATALGSIPTDRSRAAMRPLLDAPDPLLRLAAAENMGRLCETSQAARIVALLLDPNTTVRRGIPQVLAKLGVSVAAPLCSILQEKSQTVSRMGPDGKTVNVPVSPARDVALGILLRLNGVPVVRPLILAGAAQDGGAAGQAAAANAVSHLWRQLADKACRVELLRLSMEGPPDERVLALSHLADFLESKIPQSEGAADRKAALVKAGYDDIGEAMNAFAKALTDPSPDVKVRGALALCRMGDSRGKSVVLAELRRNVDVLKAAMSTQKNPSWHRKSAGLAKECLSSLLPLADKSLVDELLPLLAVGDMREGEWNFVLMRVVEIMGKVADPAYADRLLPLLKESVGHGLNSLGPVICRALGAMGAKQAFDPIVEFVRPWPNDNFFAEHRLAVYEGLFGCDRARATDYAGEVLVALRPHVIKQIEGIAMLFRRFPSRAAVLPLVHWINHDITSTAGAIKASLVALGKTDLTWLIDGFEVESHSKRRSLAGVIADGFGANALPVLLKAAEDKRPRTRQGAVWTLGCLSGREAVAAVHAALKDEHPGVRSAAVWAAGNLGDASFVDPLLALLADKDESVRSMAAEHLGAMKDLRAVQPLISALADADPRVRAYAAGSLGKLKASAAIPSLERLTEDQHPDVRAAAESALRLARQSASR